MRRRVPPRLLSSAIVASIALTIVKFTVGLRIPEEVESVGLDISAHGEKVYDL